MAELPEHDEVDGKKTRALSLDLIKQRLDRSLYKRLDLFQRDVFAVLDRARRLSRSDSQIFEDATELQIQFIKIRDESCGNGEILQSKALFYTHSDFLNDVTMLKAKKQTEEAAEDPAEEEKPAADQQPQQEGSTTSTTFNQQQYHVGDFVYAENAEKGVYLGCFLLH